MNINNIYGCEFMGDNFRDKLRFCGKEVKLYPLCKMIRSNNAELDNNCQIFDFVFIDAGNMLKIGKYSILTWNVLIEGGGNTSIGDRVFIGPGSKILTSTYAIDEFYAIEHLPLDCGKILYGDIILEDDVYIGANSIIMPGSIVKRGAVVGANSLVKGVLEPWTINVGTPCKYLRDRVPPTKERTELLEGLDWSNHL